MTSLILLLPRSLVFGVEIFFDREILPITLELLNSAEYSVKLVSFGVTHPSILDALEKAMSRGVDVEIVTDNKTFCPLSHIVDTLPALVHEKFLVVDDERVLVGTMNFTVDGMESDRNVALLIDKGEAPAIVEGFLKEFSNFENGRFQQLKSPVVADGSEMRLVFSPKSDHLRYLIPVLAGAKKEVLIAAYAFTDPQLTTVLKYLSSDGVDVKVVLDKRWNQSNSLSELRYLSKGEGLRLYPAKTHMHAKIAVIDRKWLVIGSANFTRSSRFKNDELVMFLNSRRLSEKVRKWFLNLWERSESSTGR